MSKELPESYLWITDFTSESIKDYYAKFTELEEDEEIDIIPVFINSLGGEGMVLTALRDMFKSSNKPVMTVAMGQALSSGAFLLAAGTKGMRFASDNSFIMIHEAGGGTDGRSSEQTVDAKWSSDLTKMLISGLAEDSKLTVTEINKKLDSLRSGDWVVTAKEAKRLGIVDHIDTPRVVQKPIKYEVKTKPTIKKEIEKVLKGFKKKTKKK